MRELRSDFSERIEREQIAVAVDGQVRMTMDRQGLRLHSRANLRSSAGYLGVRYSPDLIIIQVTWVGGRSTEVKKQFYRRIADEIHAKAGIRKEDVWINLVDDGREDWSFGNGDMQYAPK